MDQQTRARRLLGTAPSIHCLDVGGEAGQPNHDVRAHLEDLFKVHGDRLRLHAETHVRRNRDAVLPDHRHERRAVVLGDRLWSVRVSKGFFRHGLNPNEPWPFFFQLEFVFFSSSFWPFLDANY